MDLKELVQQTHDLAVRKGFWQINEKDMIFPAKLMLIVSELSECMEADRNNDIEGLKEELADTFIRLCDLCGALNIDIESEIIKKGQKNEKRPYKHSKKY